MLLIQGRYGAEVLPYSETLADVSLTSTAPEICAASATGCSTSATRTRPRRPNRCATCRRRRRSSSATCCSIVCLLGLVFVRWAHRRFAGLLVVAGAVLAVGVHPIDDRSPLMRAARRRRRGGAGARPAQQHACAPGDDARAGAAAPARWSARQRRRSGCRRPRWRVDVRRTGASGRGWRSSTCRRCGPGRSSTRRSSATRTRRRRGSSRRRARRAAGEGRVLQLPGAEFGAFRWGYTVDPPLPGLTDKPLVTRDLLPLGQPAAMDLLYALDDRIQDGVFEPPSLAPVARWLGVDTIWVANDLAFDRFRTARPQTLDGRRSPRAPGVGAADHVRPRRAATIRRCRWSTSRRSADPDATAPAAPVDLYPIEPPGHDRARRRPVGRRVRERRRARRPRRRRAARRRRARAVQRVARRRRAARPRRRGATDCIVTDSNRDRARHWRSSQDTTGYTESDQPELGLLRDVASDQRLPVFADRDEQVDPATQTIARQVGPVTATATATASRSPTCPSTGRTWRSTATQPRPGPSASTPIRSARRCGCTSTSRCRRSVSCRPRRRALGGSPR